MAGAEYEVEGGRELRRTLKGAGIDLSNLKNVHKQAAALVVTRARTEAPRRSGHLADSIRAGATQRAGIVRAGFARVPYGNPIHWGWPAHHIKGNPFITRAAQETQPAWLRLYLDYVENALDTVKGI
jgi:hypothetical protein